MKLLWICSTTTVNQAATSFKNFNNLKKVQLYICVPIHATITCQGIFVPVPTFADYFSSLVQAYCSLYKWRFAAFHSSRVGNNKLIIISIIINSTLIIMITGIMVTIITRIILVVMKVRIAMTTITIRLSLIVIIGVIITIIITITLIVMIR